MYKQKQTDVVSQKKNENLDPPYHLCLHERDFLIGEPICDNIRKAVEGSKCTVCVVSENWLEMTALFGCPYVILLQSYS